MSKFTVGILCLLLFGLINIHAQTYEVVIYNPTAGFDDVTVAGIGGNQRVGQARLTGQPYPEEGHALLWLGSSTAPIDLHPTVGNWDFSEAFDTDGTRQVGYVLRKIGLMRQQNAVIWNSSANDYVTLSPYYSAAYAIGGDQQVGFVSTGLSCSECGPTGGSYAVLWRGTPESAVVLNPPGFTSVGVGDTDGVQQVGGGSNNSYPVYPYDLRQRALLWYGTRTSFVDLTPAGYRSAAAVAVKNGTQVGRAVVIGEDRFKAIVWHSTAESFRDLGYGILNDTNGTTHVGYGSGDDGTGTHAIRWDGDTGQRFDLHTLLPPEMFLWSLATGINENGDIVGWGMTPNYKSIGILWRRDDPANTAPTVYLNNPMQANSFAPNGTISLTANAFDSDGTIVSVKFYANDELIGTGSSTGRSSYHINWLPTTLGSFTIKAVAADNMGATTVSPTMQHNIQYIPRRR